MRDDAEAAEQRPVRGKAEVNEDIPAAATGRQRAVAQPSRQAVAELGDERRSGSEGLYTPPPPPHTHTHARTRGFLTSHFSLSFP